MRLVTLILLLLISSLLLMLATGTEVLAHAKNDKIIKQNNKEIIVRKYKTNITIKHNLKSFTTIIDSTMWKYPPNKILYKGIITKTNDETKTIIKTKKVNNKTYNYIITNDVTKFFSSKQITNINNNIGKQLIITKVFYPKERIFYKIQ